MASRSAQRGKWLRLGALAGLAAVAVAPCIAAAKSDVLDQPSPLTPPLNFGIVPSDTALVTASPDDRSRALDCMSMAIAYEAAGQPVAGQQAVGQVILNRMRDPHFPNTVCGVVFQGSARLTGCQFTFTCDGSFRRRLADATLITARDIARTVMSGIAPDRVAGATHYHADYVQPYWAASGLRVARIGAHVFYRMPGEVLRTMAAAKSSTMAQAAPGSRAVFAPWGLPIGGAGQR